jgi:uncharacterized protein involved in exopolysaccharide biosynthesis
MSAGLRHAVEPCENTASDRVSWGKFFLRIAQGGLLCSERGRESVNRSKVSHERRLPVSHERTVTANTSHGFSRSFARRPRTVAKILQASLRKLVWLRYVAVFVAIGAISCLAGVGVYFWKIRQPEAVAVIILRSRVVADAGLAQFTDLRSLQASEIVLQLLKSRIATEYAAAQVEGYSAEEIEDGLNLESKPNSSVFQVSLQARRAEDAVKLAEAILSRALSANQEMRRDQLRNLQKVVEAQYHSSEKELKEIYKEVAARQMQVHIEASRQKQDALSRLLADYRSRISEIRVSDTMLRNVLEDPGSAEIGGVQPNVIGNGRFAEDPQLLAARRATQEAQAALAALTSRYGSSHPKVAAAEAELKKNREILDRLDEEQRRKLGLQTKSNKESIALLSTELDQALAEWRPIEASEDAELAELLARQAVQTKTFESLSTRLLEISLAAEGVDPFFDVITAPFVTSSIHLKRLIVTVALFGFAGAFLGCIIVAGWLWFDFRPGTGGAKSLPIESAPVAGEVFTK